MVVTRIRFINSHKSLFTIKLKKIDPKKQNTKWIKVLLVDNQQMVRKGLRKIIEEHNDIVVVDEASNGEEAIKLARKTTPDIILMDVNMPGIDGIEATRVITSEMQNVRVIGLSFHDEDSIVEAMQKAGASAYLTKMEAIESLVVTIRAVASVQQDP